MRPTSYFAPLLLLCGLLLPAAAHAQNSPPTDDSRAAIARVEARFDVLEERLRQMQGTIEQVEYENRRLREQLDLFQQDANIRFSELEQQARETKTNEQPATGSAAATALPKPAPSSEEKQVLKVPDRNASQFADSREHYNHAFGLLNKTQYEEAGKSFESFIEAYPKDPLIGNAYYWAGETYYVRQNYVQAVDYFRRGYEALPEGPKAGDNLLKLAMSLAALDRSSESCVVLKQVSEKFGKNSTSLKKKADMERNRLGCK